MHQDTQFYMLSCMRTTLTLDDDNAILLKRLCDERQMSLKTLVNEALRTGLRQLEAPPQASEFHTDSVSVGRCLLPNLDDIAEALSLAEGESFR